MRVGIDSGDIEGKEVEGIGRSVLRFTAIPFAAPPTGSNRFRPPQPVEPWHGLRDATRFGPASIQNPTMLEQIFDGRRLDTSEDCLFLNVWTPAIDDARRPVLFWIHGGAFVTGASSTPIYNGATFASRGDCVVVSVNYRLGPLGFLHLGDVDTDYDGSGNNGILDQLAALDWVQRNIGTFGGDPDNVTIFGESAGGMSVGTLMAIAGDGQRFRRAIPQSGAAHHAKPRSDAAAVTEKLATLIEADSLDDFLHAPSEKLAAAESALTLGGGNVLDRISTAAELNGAGLPFEPVVDGVVLDERPIDRLRRGAAAGIDVMTGTTRDEYHLFTALLPQAPSVDVLEKRLGNLTGDGAAAASLYRSKAPPSARTNVLESMAMTDGVFRMPAIELLEAQEATGSARRWMYLFSWTTPAMGGLLGSCHALELPFMWNTEDLPGLQGFVGAHAPADLADHMQDAWIAFAHTGDPNHAEIPDWSEYSADERAVMELGDENRLLVDPEADRRRLWNGLL